MEQHAEIQYNGISENKEYEEIINKVLNECFKNEGLTKLKLYISNFNCSRRNTKN